MSRLPPDGAPQPVLRRWLRRYRPHTLWIGDGAVWAWGPDAPDAPVRHADIGEWLEGHVGRRARLVVSSGLLRHVIVHDASLPLHDEAAVGAYARQQLVHYHGAPAQRWPLAAWRDSRQRGAVALGGLELDELLAATRRLSVRLTSVVPWWSVAMRRATRYAPELARSARSALALVEGRVLTVVRCERGAVADIQVRRLDEASLGALRAALDDWRREQGTDEQAVAGPLLVAGFGLADAEAPPRVIAPAVQILPGRLADIAPQAEWVLA